MPSPLLDAAIRNPYQTLLLVLGDTLHPGGDEATHALLDRAGVARGTRLLDLGCGAGAATQLARKRGADALGLDADPTAEGATIQGTLDALPLATASVDVVISECALCLADDVGAALGEANRVLTSDGCLAFSDVTLERSIPDVPAPVANALCLSGQRSRERLLGLVKTAGFSVQHTRKHRAELAAMRDRIHARVDVEGLLAAMGSRGEALLAAVDAIEEAFDAGELGYVSVVAEPV